MPPKKLVLLSESDGFKLAELELVAAAGRETSEVPEVLCPLRGSLLPKRKRASMESTLRVGGALLLRAYGSSLSPCGHGLVYVAEGVTVPEPVGVLAPEA